MVIEKLTVHNFKNYDHAEFLFSPTINIITGLNGSGKTNLLDAIHHLSLTKSAFSSTDSQNIKKGENFFALSAEIKIEGKIYAVLCSLESGEKKLLKVNKIEYNRNSEHIGRFPIVLITPYDTDIIREGSEERRKFFDLLISQINQQYLQDLIKYNHFLKQRNALLKTYHNLGDVDNDLLASYNKELVKYGTSIFAVRSAFLKTFTPSFKEFYQMLSSSEEEVSLQYNSQLEIEDFEKAIISSLEKDLFLQRTSVGIHKDDFIFKINHLPLKNFGSQGQQKTFSISLKLTQFKIYKESKSFKPALLLDDVFDKLDDKRIAQLLHLISQDFFGQIFITDARLDRKNSYLENLSKEIAIFKIEKGHRIND